MSTSEKIGKVIAGIFLIITNSIMGGGIIVWISNLYSRILEINIKNNYTFIEIILKRALYFFISIIPITILFIAIIAIFIGLFAIFYKPKKDNIETEELQDEDDEYKEI